MSDARVSKSFAMERSGHTALIEVGEASEPRAPTSPLTWLNLVCLDAPIVAVSWQWLLAKTFAIPASASNGAALFLTAWLIYLADRFGDSFSIPRGAATSLRQEFCLRHRKWWVVAIGMLAITDAVVICTQLAYGTRVSGAAIGAVAFAYLILNHGWSHLWRVLPLKEVTIGFLFAAGTLASLRPQFPLLTPSFVSVSVLFACLCALNCMCIARWECGLDRAQKRSSLATAWPALARGVLVAIGLLAGFAILGAIFRPGADVVYVALSLSALGLAVLDRFGDGMQKDTRTACADLVLLTPLIFFLA